ncbi:MAG: hypothetical protein GWN01_13605 [Nitrosopumilaceae archaeon]|nr:hypothetical protein [Nitrosopumilaceae archaeon]NIU01900.1 hypothetical protein [Nitrosopumilaceae archaeon]NIU88304.1 hypothetical protein [Nitrosopumilaceae archaeon]NIV66596.1 hypothetical protein [Nitrosopumilaceae archaeon]NIX62501.1 hypothetical protein [Nitrosopumilaceae archaeon]
MAKKKEEIPEWVADEIQNAKFGKPEQLTRTGYILEIYEPDKKMDVQLYDPVEDGRHIVTMDIPKSIKPSELERGVVYEFVFEQLKAPLSKKVVEFLKKEKGIEMGAIYQFVLKKLELLDIGADEAIE